MGVTVWTFRRAQPGSIAALPLRHFEEFFRGERRLPPNEEGFVEFVEVIVELENRRPVGLVRVGFFKHRATADGALDREHFSEVMSTVIASGDRPISHHDVPEGLVEAGHRFAQRRLQHLNRWTPSANERARLGELVNARARTKLWG